MYQTIYWRLTNMSVGLEGDTRKFKHLRSTDHYEVKAAVQAERQNPRSFKRCGVCGQPIVGQDFGGFCLKCKDEPL